MLSRDKDIFVKVEYVVAWAGCRLPLADRTFEGYDEACAMADAVENNNTKDLSVRVETVSVKTQIEVSYRPKKT